MSTLAPWHALNLSMFEMCRDFRRDGMLGYSRLQEREFAPRPNGFRAARLQAFVGAGYFDRVQQTIMGGNASTLGTAHKAALSRGISAFSSRSLSL